MNSNVTRTEGRGRAMSGDKLPGHTGTRAKKAPSG